MERGVGGIMLDIAALQEAILQRKNNGNLTWKQVADESGVSAPTLTRIMKGEVQPDTETVGKLARWLRLPVDRFYQTPGVRTRIIELPEHATSTPDIVEFHLRADKNLSPKTAEALAEMFRLIYEAYARKERGEGG